MATLLMERRGNVVAFATQIKNMPFDYDYVYLPCKAFEKLFGELPAEKERYKVELKLANVVPLIDIFKVNHPEDIKTLHKRPESHNIFVARDGGCFSSSLFISLFTTKPKFRKSPFFDEVYAQVQKMLCICDHQFHSLFNFNPTRYILYSARVELIPLEFIGCEV
jgi:hypothetical protein